MDLKESHRGGPKESQHLQALSPSVALALSVSSMESPPLTDGTPSKQVFHHGTNVQRGSKVSQQLSVNGDLAAT